MHNDPKENRADFWTYLIIGALVFMSMAIIFEWEWVPDGPVWFDDPR